MCGSTLTSRFSKPCSYSLRHSGAPAQRMPLWPIFAMPGCSFPRRLRSGARKGELVWGELGLARVLEIVHNPRYAGAFCFGRTRTRTWPDGKQARKSVCRGGVAGAVTRASMRATSLGKNSKDNQRRLQESAQAYGRERRKSPPREGPALLQGIVICGVCGQRMTVRYHERQGQLYPDYVCHHESIAHAAPPCQRLPGQAIDAAMAQLLLATVTPLNLEVALAVQQELVNRCAEADALRAKQVTRVQYEADLAGQRYRRVDPNNRLVAATLEAEWNAALRMLQEVQQETERHRQADRLVVGDEMRAQVMALTTDFPRVWHDPHTTDRDRKRLVRLLVQDVTLLKTDKLLIQVRFRGGAIRTLTIPPARRIWQTWQTPPAVVADD